jgi:hypothetical protein
VAVPRADVNGSKLKNMLAQIKAGAWSLQIY